MNRNKLKIADFVVGGGSKDVCKKLMNKLKECTIDTICTDGNYAYDECIPTNITHCYNKI